MPCHAKAVLNHLAWFGLIGALDGCIIVGQRLKRKETGKHRTCSGTADPAVLTRHQKEKSDAPSGRSTKFHLVTATNTLSDISHQACAKPVRARNGCRFNNASPPGVYREMSFECFLGPASDSRVSTTGFRSETAVVSQLSMGTWRMSPVVSSSLPARTLTLRWARPGVEEDRSVTERRAGLTASVAEPKSIQSAGIRATLKRPARRPVLRLPRPVASIR